MRDANKNVTLFVPIYQTGYMLGQNRFFPTNLSIKQPRIRAYQNFPINKLLFDYSSGLMRIRDKYFSTTVTKTDCHSLIRKLRVAVVFGINFHGKI